MKNKISKSELVKLIVENNETLNSMDDEIIHSLISETISEDINKVHAEKLTFGDKAADKLATFAGSWVFISGFAIILLLWIIVNTLFMIKPFDPYPYILLNLVLSCIAAIQAPIIMMSQNRQEAKDRIRADNDFKINLKSELIIEDLHYKLDKLLENQEEIKKALAGSH